MIEFLNMTLTRFRQGSFRELLTIALPLMISSLSVMSMIFVDRLLLAHYSTEAMNAAVNATTYGWSFIGTWMVLAGISEVFVAQYNGAGFKEKIGEPVWQMIWLSLGSFLFFIPAAYWLGEWTYGNHAEFSIAKEYLKWMMLFGPSFPLYSALCGFFVGRGKTALVTWLALAANIVNILLDWVLIFGWGWIPSLGPTGAAIATSSSSVFQCIVLLIVFLKPNYRKEFGTANLNFRIKPFWHCLKIGFPAALFVGLEILGFAVYYSLMTSLGEIYITVAGICQSVVLLFWFFGEGVSKAATAVAGNLIGGKRTDLIENVLTAGVKLHLVFFVITLVLYYFFADDLAHQFLPQGFAADVDIFHLLMLSLLCMVFYLLFEGIRLLFLGILTAAGDTKFLALAGSFAVWILFLLPIYLIVYLGHSPVIVAPILCAIYALLACLIYASRFYSGKWKREAIITQMT